MDTLENYRQIVERVLDEYAQIPYAYGEIEKQIVLERQEATGSLPSLSLGWYNALNPSLAGIVLA